MTCLSRIKPAFQISYLFTADLYAFSLWRIYMYDGFIVKIGLDRLDTICRNQELTVGTEEQTFV